MPDSKFVSADIDKLVNFKKESAEAIAEFASIKETFESVNETLLESWKGEGADSYKKQTRHILENIGSLEDILIKLNEDVVDSIIEAYNTVDNDLAEINRNPEILILMVKKQEIMQGIYLVIDLAVLQNWITLCHKQKMLI